MNDLKLKELEINAFRGIKHEDLKLDSKSLVLLGENGTGKSSIVQSIEYLLTSKVGALEGKGRGDLRQDVAIRFFGKNASDLNVKATFSNDLTIERNTTGLYGPDEIKSIIKQLSNGSNILNRKKLLDYVDSQPKDSASIQPSESSRRTPPAAKNSALATADLTGSSRTRSAPASSAMRARTHLSISAGCPRCRKSGLITTTT